MNEYSFIFNNIAQFPNHNLDNFNISIYEKDNKRHLNKVNNVPSYYLINKHELEKNNIAQDTKTTSTKKMKKVMNRNIYFK